MRGNKKRKVDEPDRLSELPDDILGSILSHLLLEEAAQTSILSSRWRHIWMIRDVLDFHDLPISITRDSDNWDSLDTQIQFIDWVDGVLEKYKEPTLNEFTVKSDWLCNSIHSERILHWICFAIQKRVQRLDLALSCYRYLGSLKPLYHYKLQSQYLHGGHSFPGLNFLLSEVEGFSSFVTNLKVLRLQSFHVDGELLTYLISTCPVLEHLSISFSHSLVNLQVQAPSIVNLKYFEICYCPYIKTIHFDDAPNLECTRFISIGCNATISIKNAPHLINVSLGKFYYHLLVNLVDLPQLSNHFSQLEVLTLEVESAYSSEGLSFLGFPTMIHLKQLTLRLRFFVHSYLFLHCLLVAMPSLYCLHLKVEYRMLKVEKIPEGVTFRHESLQVVEWNGYESDENDYSFVKFLVDTCKKLNKFTITKGTRDTPFWPYDFDPPAPKKEELTMKLLKSLESKGVQVIML